MQKQQDGNGKESYSTMTNVGCGVRASGTINFMNA